MLRLKFNTKQDRESFFSDLKESHGESWKNFAKNLDVNHRTFYDWKNGKTLIPIDAFHECIKRCSLKKEKYSYSVVSENELRRRNAIKGGVSLIKKHGNPGTFEGRRKGGGVSQERRKEDPSEYKNCNLRKKIKTPEESEKLAEFIGLFLGDGGISKENQATITLNKQKDSEYIDFVCNFIEELFAIKPAVYSYKTNSKKNIKTVAINSRNLIIFLKRKGIVSGNKVAKQVEVPQWIKKSESFSRSCLRGLIDTDGGVFCRRRKGKIKGVGIVFTNRSKPLLNFVKKVLKKNEFHPKISSRNEDILLYRNEEVVRYLNFIGFSNPYKRKRVQYFINGGVG